MAAPHCDCAFFHWTMELLRDTVNNRSKDMPRLSQWRKSVKQVLVVKKKRTNLLKYSLQQPTGRPKGRGKHWFTLSAKLSHCSVTKKIAPRRCSVSLRIKKWRKGDKPDHLAVQVRWKNIFNWCCDKEVRLHTDEIRYPRKRHLKCQIPCAIFLCAKPLACCFDKRSCCHGMITQPAQINERSSLIRVFTDHFYWVNANALTRSHTNIN